ncbi:hypothetical protein [Myxococcus faecalis]|uniref:hypothetical protein n=1 Tax=Myxococcus faecalis TaxID=3115646 RepID=UPI003CFBB9F7
MPHWRELLPDRRGSLPLGGDLVRTDASGPADAAVAILGVYPAATKLSRWEHDGLVCNLPTQVERTSFEPVSRSGRDLDARYLAPLGLNRSSVLITDLWPYYLSTTVTGKRGRSMADNVARYEAETGRRTAVEPRPAPDELLARSRELPGNLDRLAEVLGNPALRLLLTLGTEAAAFVRGLTSIRDAQKLLYGAAVELEPWGRPLSIVHLTHPGNLMRKLSGWQRRHEDWCSALGHTLVAQARRR